MQLFQPDHEVPATRVLFDTSEMAARIRPWFRTRHLSLSISNIRYKPNTSCLVSYQIETENGNSHCHVKAFQKNDWEIRKRKLVPSQASSDSANDVLIDDEFAFAMFRFPSDSELPGISKFDSDPQGFLSSVLLQNHSGEKFTSYETLAYKPNRRYTAKLNFESGNRFVLKVHDASTVDRTLMSARVLGRSSLSDLPERVGRSVRHRTLVYQWIGGASCDLASIESGEHRSLVESVFDFLNRLHSTLDPTKGSLPVRLSADGLVEIAEYLANIYPPVAERARKICNELLANLDVNHPWTLIHGDFHEQQIVLTQNGVRACDFDNCCLGDPTADLANFVAHLHYRASLNEISMVDVAQINHWSMRHLADIGERDFLNRHFWSQLAGMFRLTTHPFRSGAKHWMDQTDKFVSHIAEQIKFAKNTFHAKTYTSVKGQNGSRNAFGSIEQENVTSRSHLFAEAIQSDSKFKFLAKALNSVSADQAIQQLDPPLDKAYGRFEIDEIIVRRYKPGRRCLIEYELATTTGRRSVLGKASAKRLDRIAFDAQSELYLIHGFGDDSADGIRVPRPLGCFEPWRMWFQEKVCATPGDRFLENGQLGSVTERIAAAMAKLHSCDFSPLRPHSAVDELTILGERLNQVSAERPSESERIERVLTNCVSIAEAIDDNKSVPIHRDFYFDQIMFSDQRTYLVDLDLVSFGHPALDVGNFLAHLTEHAVRRFDDRQHWFDEENEITNSYLAQMCHVSSAEIEAFKAISFARHIFISWTMENRRKFTSRIIGIADELACDSVHRLSANDQTVRQPCKQE